MKKESLITRDVWLTWASYEFIMLQQSIWLCEVIHIYLHVTINDRWECMYRAGLMIEEIDKEQK